MQVLVAVNDRRTSETDALDGELVMPRPADFESGPAFVGVASLRPAERAEVVELAGVDAGIVSVAVADALHRLGLLTEVWSADDEALVDAQLERMALLVAA